MKNFIIASAIGFSLFGCSTATIYTDKPMIRHDKDTEYSVEDNQNGFVLSIFYERYQFTPESTSVAASCKSALTSLAWEIAQKKGRDIQQINDQQIKLSMGRNGFTGITSCSASVPVKLKEK